MARISEQTIEHIRSAADIVDVVGSFIELKKKGKDYKGICPFHDDTKPSLSVSPARQIYKCFVCDHGGNAFNFVMEYEQLEFVDAVKFLADKYNIELNLNESSGVSRDLKTQLLEIHKITAQHYAKNLDTTKGDPILHHLQERGLTKETIQAFQIGYSLDSYDKVLNGIRKHNFSSEAMKNSGLFYESEKGFMDRFRGRIMFSITNAQGKVIAFAGRVFKKDDPAKYVNSPETPIYNKSQILYGLFNTRKAIQESKHAIIVEGYLDFLQLYQAGIQNIVAVSGTSFTEQHATILKRYCDEVVIAYDGDSAGVSAAIRAGYVMLLKGLSPKIVTIPEHLDPDDWVKNEGPVPFQTAVKKATPLIKFHYNNFNGDVNSTAGLNQFLNDSLDGISQINDPITRELYARELAQISNVSEESIFQSLRVILDKRNYQKNMRAQSKTKEQSQQKSPQLNSQIKSASQTRLEDDLIRLCFSKNQKLRLLIFDNMNTDWIQSQTHKTLFSKIYIHLNSESCPQESIILNELNEENDRRKLIHLTFDLNKMDPTISMVKECLIRLESSWIQNNMNHIREQLKKTTNVDMKIVSELNNLQNQKLALKRKYSDS